MDKKEKCCKEEPPTLIGLRDEIVRCFIKAHEEVMKYIDEIKKEATPEEIENIKQLNVEAIVRKAFTDVGGDYESPTKKTIILTLEELKKFATYFRKPEIIEENYKKMMDLALKLD